MSIMSCHRASELASASMDRRLTFGEHASWRAHQLICRGCRAYRRQLAVIRQALRAMDLQPFDSPQPTLSVEARGRIQRALDQRA